MAENNNDDIITLDYFKRHKDPNNSKVHFFETAWRRKPRSIKKEKYENIEVLDLRWGTGKGR